MTGRPHATGAGHDHVVADQSEVSAFLARPETHGAGVATVERIDTHGAMVFLAGTRAYKVKRAVRYPYMDFSTLELRRDACRREVELNRRTAPELYLGAEAVVRGANGDLALGGPGEPVEWLVVMTRFDQDQLCDRLAQGGKLTPALMRDLADEIIAFHGAAERLTGAQAVGGGAAGLGAVIEENSAELRERPQLFPSAEVEDYDRHTRRELARTGPLLDARLAAGQVRRCHGDLHLRNICVIDGRPTIFDAIEFNDAIACIDVLYDLAFLLMDLEHRGLRPYANLILNRYLRSDDDLKGLAALPLLLSIRAAVRAKVSVSMADSQPDTARAQGLHEEAKAYLQAARGYLMPAHARLIAIGGLSGTGKTSLARVLAPELGASPGAVHLRSDVLRKTVFGVGELARLPPDAYTPEASHRVYDEVLRRAGIALGAGRTVIADAVFAQADERAAVESLARAHGIAFVGLWLECPLDSIIARVGARRGDASDADAEVARLQAGYEIGKLSWRLVDASGKLSDSVAAARAALQA